MNDSKGAQLAETGTEQVNLRISRGLLGDIERISSMLGVNKTDWIRSQLADGVLAAKVKLIEDAGRLRSAGVLSEEEFEKIASGIRKEMLKSGNKPGGRP